MKEFIQKPLFPIKITRSNAKSIIHRSSLSAKDILLVEWKDLVIYETVMVHEELYDYLIELDISQLTAILPNIFGQRVVYEVEDYITCIEDGNNNLRVSNKGNFRIDSNTTQKIVSFQYDESKEVNAIGHLGGAARLERFPNAFRHATLSEIDSVLPQYKAGELIAVKRHSTADWQLRYTTGKRDGMGQIGVFMHQHKEGEVTYYPIECSTNDLKLPD